MTWRVAALDDSHDLTAFSCGNLKLDTWLRDHAVLAAGQGTRTFAVVDNEDVVVGYFAITPHLIDRPDAPMWIAPGGPRRIPAVLLAKLALDRNLQGQGLGAELLVRALGTIVEAARVAGGKVVIVDAIDQTAAAFYRHHDFEPLPNRDDRLMMKLSTAARALGVDWP